jgi:hypothetical protein
MPSFAFLCVVLFAFTIVGLELGPPPQFIDKALLLFCVFGVSLLLIAVGAMSWVLADMLPSQGEWPAETSRVQWDAGNRNGDEREASKLQQRT